MHDGGSIEDRGPASEDQRPAYVYRNGLWYTRDNAVAYRHEVHDLLAFLGTTLNEVGLPQHGAAVTAESLNVNIRLKTLMVIVVNGKTLRSAAGGPMRPGPVSVSAKYPILFGQLTGL